MSLPQPSSGAEEYLDAEIEITDTSATAEAEIHRVLDPLPGVESISIAGAKVMVRYDSTLTTREKIVGILNGAGVAVRSSDTHRDSSMTEIEDQVQPYLPSMPEKKDEPERS